MALEIKRNILLKIEYCGRDFSGWQSQRKGRTVQVTIKQALEKFLRHKISLIAAGRTDAGVHALSQYANFHTHCLMETENIKYKLNKLLPPDIVIHACCQVDSNFDSRKDALKRTYRYIISEKPSALLHGYAWILARSLDLQRLESFSRVIQASDYFHNFCKTKSLKLDNRCQIFSASWKRMDSQLFFEITANRFLHNMVRLLVGTMVAVVDGKLNVAKFENMFNKNVSDKAIYIAPPHGLYLIDVQYEGISL